MNNNGQAVDAIVVVLLEDLPKKKLKRGRAGIVVSLLDDGNCKVEFSDFIQQTNTTVVPAQYLLEIDMLTFPNSVMYSAVNRWRSAHRQTHGGGREARISEKHKEEIRRRREAGERGVDLAKEFGINSQYLSRIYHGKEKIRSDKKIS